jgi:prefoldin subunit 5
MVTVTYRRRNKNGKIEVVPLGSDKYVEVHARGSMEILAKRSKATKKGLKRRRAGK